jgi:hypothetical protein
MQKKINKIKKMLELITDIGFLWFCLAVVITLIISSIR